MIDVGKNIDNPNLKKYSIIKENLSLLKENLKLIERNKNNKPVNFWKKKLAFSILDTCYFLFSHSFYSLNWQLSYEVLSEAKKITKQFKRREVNLKFYIQAVHWNQSMWRIILIFSRELWKKKYILSSSFLLAKESTERSTSLKRILLLNDKNQKNVIFTTSQQIKL